MSNNLLLKKGILQLGIVVTDDHRDQLLLYFKELKKWGKRINLIARETSDEKIIENHFIDSLSLLLVLGDEEGTLLDVGTGGGFPGLVLAVVQPERNFVLVEPRKKRVSFLQHIIRTLKLQNVEVIDSRLEEYLEHKDNQTPAFVTSRAVAAPSLFLPMIDSWLEDGAKAILMLARKELLQEISTFEKSYEVITTKSFSLPFSKASRILAVVISAS